MPFKLKKILLALPLLFAATTAQAYIGPGAGAGTIAVVLGILASIVMGFFAILWYPVKRMIRKRKAGQTAKTTAPESADGS